MYKNFVNCFSIHFKCRSNHNSRLKRRTAEYFVWKAKKEPSKEKLLVALEMSKYLTAAREHGLLFEELKKAGFKFATLSDIKN